MDVVAFLREHGLALLWGTTVVLGAGVLAVAISRAPIHRQRLAELAVAAGLIWVVLAAVPLPRPLQRTEAPVQVESVLPGARLRTEPAVERPDAFLARHRTRQLARSVVPSTALDHRAALVPVRVPAAPVDWAGIAVWIYVVGAGLCAAYVLLGYVVLWRVLRGTRRPDAWVAEMVLEFADGVGRTPRVRVTPRSCRPFCTGILRPTIVLPESLCARRNATALRHVLLHELAHYRQRDGRGQALFAAAMPLLFLHPLYWWLRSRAHLSAELVADDLAARHSDRATYARALIRFSERGGGPALIGAASVLRSPSEFYRRMNMLLNREQRLSTRCSRVRRHAQAGAAATLVAVTASLWGVPDLAAQSPDQVRELRAERNKLRADVKSLRVEIADLRRLLEAKQSEAEEPSSKLHALDTLFGVEEPEPEETFEVVSGEEFAEFLETVAEPEVEFVELDGAVTLEEPELFDALLLEEFEEVPATGTDATLFGLIASEAPSGAVVADPFATKTTHDSSYIVELVTRAIDLRGEYDIAEQEVELTKRRGAIEPEVKIHQIRCKTVERKLRAVCAMIRAETKAAQLELDAMKNQAEALRGMGAPHREVDQAVIRLEARLELLCSVQ